MAEGDLPGSRANPAPAASIGDPGGRIGDQRLGAGEKLELLAKPTGVEELTVRLRAIVD